MPTALNRRDRVRAATVTEIKDTARRILVADGPEALSLRGIARDMGMTAPALYRYFPSREELVVGLIADLYGELAGTMEAARDAVAADDDPGRLAAACRAFRRWAIEHPREFALLFGSPMPGIEVEQDTAEKPSPAHQAGQRFGRVFGELVARIWLTRPFPIRADDELDPVLLAQLRGWGAAFPVPLPAGVVQVFLSCWMRLYGMVAMEVFGHLDFAVRDAGPMFESELSDLAAKLGVTDRF